MNKIIVAVSVPSLIDEIVANVFGVSILIVANQLNSNNNATINRAGPYPEVYDTPWGTKVKWNLKYSFPGLKKKRLLDLFHERCY